MFKPGDKVFAKRRKQPAFEVVRRVGDSDLFEVKGNDHIPRFFWLGDLTLVDVKAEKAKAAQMNTAIKALANAS